MAESPESRPRRLPYIVLAYVCVGLGAAGVVLPLLPTTPFIILAAWAAARGSPRLDRWLHEHPRFGPTLCAWRDEGAVPTRAKIVACVLMFSSWVIMLAMTSSAWVPAITGVIFLCVGTYLCTRPAPRSRPSEP